MIQKLTNLFKKLRYSETKWEDIKAYIQGSWRYGLYYSDRSLLRKHVLEQIDYRIGIMDEECFEDGVCKHCGCETTALQMASKTCIGNEYPPIVSKVRWNRYMNGDIVIIRGGYMWTYNPHTKGTHVYKKKGMSYIHMGIRYKSKEKLCLKQPLKMEGK